MVQMMGQTNYCKTPQDTARHPQDTHKTQQDTARHLQDTARDLEKDTCKVIMELMTSQKNFGHFF